MSTLLTCVLHGTRSGHACRFKAKLQADKPVVETLMHAHSSLKHMMSSSAQVP